MALKGFLRAGKLRTDCSGKPIVCEGKCPPCPPCYVCDICPDGTTPQRLQLDTGSGWFGVGAGEGCDNAPCEGLGNGKTIILLPTGLAPFLRCSEDRVACHYQYISEPFEFRCTEETSPDNFVLGVDVGWISTEWDTDDGEIVVTPGEFRWKLLLDYNLGNGHLSVQSFGSDPDGPVGCDEIDTDFVGMENCPEDNHCNSWLSNPHLASL